MTSNVHSTQIRINLKKGSSRLETCSHRFHPPRRITPLNPETVQCMVEGVFFTSCDLAVFKASFLVSKNFFPVWTGGQTGEEQKVVDGAYKFHLAGVFTSFFSIFCFNIKHVVLLERQG